MIINYFRGGNFFESAFYNPLIDDFDFQVFSVTPTQIVGVNPGTGVVTTFTGTGFSGSPTPPLPGTLTGFSMVDDAGQPLATITGINWALQAALTAIEAAVGSNATTLLASLLSLQDIMLDASAAVERLFGLDLAGITSDITVIGSVFNDDIFGARGNDLIDVGNIPVGFDTEEVIHGSPGNDTIDFSGLVSGDSYFVITYSDLTAPITVNLNALTNVGTITKGSGQGTDTIVGVSTLMDSRIHVGDFHGTTLADNFTVRAVEFSNIFLHGGRGADTYNLTLAAGSSITLNFAFAFADNPTQGLVFNGSTGVIANDGFGFAERLTLARSGGVNDSVLQIRGTRFADSITGSTGRDSIRPDGGNDTLDGGEGFDRVRYDRPQFTSGITVDLTAGTATGQAQGAAFSHRLTRIEEVSGSQFDDTIRGSSVDESLSGNDGSDIIEGKDGNDGLFGGTTAVDGEDELYGGTGNDTIRGGTAAFTFIEGGQGNDLIEGSSGYDQISYVSSTGAVNVNLATGGATDGFGTTDAISQIEEVRGSLFSDRLTGDVLANSFLGLDGADTINGGDGIDQARYNRDSRFAGGTGGIDVDLALQRARDGFGDIDTLINIENIIGSDVGDTIRGDSISNRLEGRSGNDLVDGRAGNDEIFGGDGNDKLRGGGGNDMLFGNFHNDWLYGDGLKVAFVSDLSAQVYRLYQATLGRAPDTAGHLDWTTRLAEGDATLSNVAAAFVGSREFTNVYGPSLTNTQFVTLLYDNVLNRAPDAAGLNGWLARMAAGTSRADVVTGFSESAEFRNATRTDSNAFTQSHTDMVWTDDVYRLYEATLNRAPDLAGLLDWTNRLGTGTEFLTAVAGFVGSREFQNIYGTLTNAQFVTLLYNNVLDRAPDTGGLNDWLSRMAGGTTRAEVVQGFAQSREFITATAADLTAWVLARGTDDILHGGTGNNTLYGGALSDTFIFDSGEGLSTHRVMDLEAWDTLEFRNFGYSQDSEIRAGLTQVGANVTFAGEGVSITFVNVQLSLFTDDMLTL